MKRSVAVWQFLGFGFTSLGGTLLHFLYDFTDNSILAAPFSGVNESTWEHMKLLFFPMFVFSIFQSFFFTKEHSDFWCVKLKGTLLGLLLIPVLFYTYIGIFGISSDVINISIFFISAAIAYFFETRQFKKDEEHCPFSVAAFACLCLIGLLFVILTFRPIQIPLLKDPVTGTYGI